MHRELVITHRFHSVGNGVLCCDAATVTMEETIGRESPSDTLKTADEMEEELKALRTKTAELELEYVEFRRTWAALLRPGCHEIDDSRAREDGLSVEEKIRFEKKRVEQLESATRDDQIVASFGKMVTKDLEKKVSAVRAIFKYIDMGAVPNRTNP